MPIRIVITDDHPIILEALRSVFRMQKEFDVVASCRSGRECVAAVEMLKPDVVVLDLSLPEMSGIDIIREINSGTARARIVLWTAAFDEDDLTAALRLGVAGVVLKQMDTEALIACIRRVAGSDGIDRVSIARALELLRGSRGANEGVSLSNRETEIVTLLSRGMSNKDIAGLLAISAETVKTHVGHIYEKLGLNNRAELGAYAKEKGFI